MRDDQWERLYPILKACPGIYVGREPATRRFVAAVLWMARAGCAWRRVPDAFGRWNSLYQRFARWQEKGVWQALMEHLAADADHAWLMLDSTVVRAHACAAGAKKTEGEPALGRSRGGCSTKLHAAGDALGNPLAFRLTAGQQGDAPQALPLLDRLAAQAVLADKADDTDAILRAVAAAGALAVIPPKATRVHQRPTDWQLYQQRHQIEFLFGFMKHYRRVFARFEKLARRHLAFVHLVAACILLR